jgi:hypothetical protein
LIGFFLRDIPKYLLQKNHQRDAYFSRLNSRAALLLLLRKVESIKGENDLKTYKNGRRAYRMMGSVLAAATLSLSLAACVVEPAQPEVVRVAPPAPRAEAPPPPRPGFVWVNGHWKWAHGDYVWEPGHWKEVRVGYHWVPGHWAERGGGWAWIEGHWAS